MYKLTVMLLLNLPVVYAICWKSNGYIFDQKLVRSGALLHDIARLQRHHAKTGGELFLQLGYPEISQIISQHHGLLEATLDEAAIVFLADKLIEETQRVSIEKRFADNLHKCKSPEAMKAHERQLKQARALQDMIQIHLCSDIDTLTYRKITLI